jgi:AraC family transcriptional regulator
LNNSKENIECINKVVKYIERTIDKELPLEELAELAFFSPFHFQKIFKEILGESPKQYIKRLRLEEAARILAFQPEQNILEVAFQVGFQSLESFSRAFKDYYTVSPNNYKKAQEIERINITQIPYSKNIVIDEPEIEISLPSQNFEFDNLQIDIVKLPVQKCVYLQTTMQSQQLIKESFKRINQWSQAHELYSETTKLFGLIKDYPIFTSLDKCRYLTCASVNTATTVSGLIGYLEIPSSKYASFKITGDFRQIIKGASNVVHNWLPQSGYKLKLEPIIQIPVNNLSFKNFNENLYQIYIPVHPV